MMISVHTSTKWASKIISLQDGEGKWSYFHSLSSGSKVPVTTEQALRRLEILGFTAEDECIRKALAYMHRCLTGEEEIPDRREKVHDWDVFISMMLAAWIRRFTKDDPLANGIAEKWSDIISTAFISGKFDYTAYENAFYRAFCQKPKGGRLTDISQFYLVSMMRDMLDPQTESAFVRHILHHPKGIYYVWEKPLSAPPEFESLAASRYLGALELLADYRYSKEQLSFAAEWLRAHQKDNHKWDMGPNAKDGVYFPLSDSWRKAEQRETDCTTRIRKLLTKLLS